MKSFGASLGTSLFVTLHQERERALLVVSEREEGDVGRGEMEKDGRKSDSPRSHPLEKALQISTRHVLQDYHSLMDNHHYKHINSSWRRHR